MRWEVSKQESGLKLQAFLKEKLGEGYSARQIKKLIEEKGCKVNGRIERFASSVLGEGDKVEWLHAEPVKSARWQVERARILYEDSFLFIYDKPASITSENLAALLPEYFLAHRLDKETSGILIFAKSEEVRDMMFELFRKHEVRKSYLALVNGTPKEDSGVVENFLGKVREYQGQSIWGEVPEKRGLWAYTEWHVVERGKGKTLLRCLPKTGRTHQIRVHLSSIGLPIVGDYQYGREFTEHASRHLLHAEEVGFVHPKTREHITVKAPRPF